MIHRHIQREVYNPIHILTADLLEIDQISDRKSQ